ncbi:hypothetical protein IQ260_00520 [Leptolyngbya cf. ectocarpi LEGE 11479]|uniref:Uncharacterized protein n=1 Tax=Leptolyngbya cf. ectocarpi LEGE 11479 TaxID=1828722 RepID=A0A928WZK3_LEPEC|nr:hypothetical protein [Leptolyngbya ectocarpi]MBE9065136.1 hypothetical protein [Leptolyngbya cf. ectocarpi LEGE 11479]
MTAGKKFDVVVLARRVENAEEPAGIKYGEIVFCPDAAEGVGIVYIGGRDGTVRVLSILPPVVDGAGGFLDAFPGGSVFALEQVYTQIKAPFYTEKDGDVNLIIGSQYYGLPGDGKLSIASGGLIGQYEYTHVESSSSIEVSANRLVIGVLSISSTFGDVSDRLQVWLDSERIFQVNADNTIEVFAPRVNGSYSGINVGLAPPDDQFFCFATLVEGTSVKCWINGLQVVNQETPEVASAIGFLKVYMRGGSWKFLGTWSDEAIPASPQLCINAVVAHYV